MQGRCLCHWRQRERSALAPSGTRHPAETGLPPAYEIAKVYAALAERDAAISWLENAYERKANQLAFIGVDPELDVLRGDPSSDAIVTRIGL